MTDGDARSSGEAEHEIQLTVKDTRKGKLLTFSDVDSKGGIRAMTSAEVKAHDYIENIISSFDTEKVEPGRVGTVYLTENGELSTEWHSEEARIAAGDDKYAG